MSPEHLPRRYSHLAPFELTQEFQLAVEAVYFFSPNSYEENCKIIGKAPTPNKFEPFDGASFIKYLEQKKILPDAWRFRSGIANLLARLERAGLLSFVGQGSNIFLGKHYYFLKELTKLEKANPLLFSEALGPRFLKTQYGFITIQITGTTKEGDVHAGTGLILSSNSILTCAHVLTDMNVDKFQTIDGKQYKVSATIAHHGIDVGILRVEPELEMVITPVFRDPYLSESVYTLGYPRVPLARSAPLIMQSGEITATKVELFHGADVFLYSAIARPGNSGGPILSATGHVIGIVTDALTDDAHKFSSPFHAGIRSSTIRQALHELEPSLSIPFENYE